MSDGIQAAAEVAAAAPAIAQPAPVAVPAPVVVQAPFMAPAATPAPATDVDPPWLPKRLERARDAALKEAEAKYKPEIETREAKLAELQSAVAERDRVLAELATSTLESLDEKQRAAVLQIAGDKDPRRQLETVKALKSSGLLSAAQPQAPAPLPAPASTTAAQPAPAPATPTAPNHLAVWQQLKATNPVRAAQYLLAHQAEIVKAANQQS